MGRNQLSADSRQLVVDRIPDYEVLGEEDRLAEVLGVISKDFYLYCEKNLQIVDKDGEVVTLKPNWAQKILVDSVLDDIAHERPARYIILKARQMGLSTIIEALGYWWTATHKNVRSVIMAHEKKSSEELYQMFRNYFEFSDPLFKPSRKYNTRQDLVFDVDDNIKEEREKQGLPPLGLSSRIRIMLPSSGAGRGHTIRFFHGCLHKDSLVVLADGSSKPIKNIEVGDKVFTSSGAVAPVSFKTMTGTKQTYKVNSWMTNEPIIATADHKILTEGGYKKVSELTNKDWIAKPKYRFEEKYEWEFNLPMKKRPQNGGTQRETYKKFKLDKDFGYLVGYYLAEGHVKKKGDGFDRVTFAYERSETFVKNVEKFFPCKASHKKWDDNNRGVTHFHNTFMAHALNEICGRVESKHVPLFGNGEFYKGILQGYLDGDGSKTDPCRVRAISIHEKIARNINRIGDMLGQHASLQHSSKRMRYGVETKPVWNNSFCHGTSRPWIKKYKFVDGQCFVRVKSVEEYEIAETYDLEIDHPDHNFETPGGIVSNSEVASWDNSADVVSSTMQAIPLRKNTFAFLESTANGIGGYFWSEWQNAKKGASSFKPLFFPWYKDPEYQLEGFVSDYTDEEKELIDLMREEGIDEELFPKKILWMRAKRREFTNEPEKWYQEYPKNDVEAFLKSGRPRFDMDVLLEMQKAAEKAPAPLYGHIIMEHGRLKLEEVEKRENDSIDPTPLKVWEKPKKVGKYVIGVDVSEGIAVGLKNKEGDYSVIDVMDMNYKTVARWRGHIDPDALAEQVKLLGEYYNYALIGVEVNNHGLTTVQKLRDSFYRNLYMRETPEDNQFQERTSKMGWRTDIRSKRVMIDDLAQALRENVIIDVDIVFISECMSYVVDDQGRTNAQEGMFDDTVIAKAIALQMAQWSNPLDGDLEVYKNKSRTRRHGKDEEDEWDRTRRSQGPTKRLTREAIRQQNRRRAS